VYSVHHHKKEYRIRKISVLALLLCLPTSLFALILLLLLAYNGFSVFYLHLPFPAKSPPLPANFSPGYSAGESVRKWSSSSSSSKLASSVMYAVKEEHPTVILKTHLLRLRNSTRHGKSKHQIKSNPNQNQIKSTNCHGKT
jgi:lactosylceramide 4-alpha-galactosyltransferase